MRSAPATCTSWRACSGVSGELRDLADGLGPVLPERDGDRPERWKKAILGIDL
jgi:hypothetical protein